MTDRETAELLKKAVAALEERANAQPCDDAISRIDALNAVTMAEFRNVAIENIELIPNTYQRKTPECEDCISRQEAISAIQYEYYDHAVGIDIVDIIAHMPPVQPTRPTGKWIDLGDESLVFKCSLCGNKKTIESHFCPNCGARMEAEA